MICEMLQIQILKCVAGWGWHGGHPEHSQALHQYCHPQAAQTVHHALGTRTGS